MAEMKLFDQKMYDYIKEDFKKGGKHEKVFRCIMLFWFCVFIVFMIFCYQYYTTPATAQVMDAYYVSKDVSEYKVASYYIEVEVQGRVKNLDYETFVENVAEEYKDKFQDAFVLYVRFYSKYRLDPNTSKPDQRPIGEFTRYTEKYLPFGSTEKVEGIVADHVEVTGTALEMAKYFLKKQLSEMPKSGYVNWKIEDFTEEYVYETGQIKGDTKVTVYRLTYRFQAKEPDSIVLTENMSIDKEGWVTSADWEDVYFCLLADGSVSHMILSEKEYKPGEKGFALRLKKMLNAEDSFENDFSAEYAFHMTNAMDSELEFDLENRYIMTKEEVEVRGIPDFRASVNRVVSYQIVDVYAVAYVEDGKWALIGFDPFDAAHDNIGWVPVEDLMEYSEENYQLLNYPVTIQEGCVDLKSGELIVENGPFRVKYMDGSAEISDVGSWSRTVSVEQIIYPPFEKEVNP